MDGIPLVMIIATVVGLWIVLKGVTIKKFEDDPAELVGDGEYDQEVVGESFYSKNLQKIRKNGGSGYSNTYIARLICDNNNKHDKNAVAVYIMKRQVGHLSAKDAIKHRKTLMKAGISGKETYCQAVILGDSRSDLWGVFLDYDMNATKSKYKEKALSK